MYISNIYISRFDKLSMQTNIFIAVVPNLHLTLFLNISNLFINVIALRKLKQYILNTE